MSTNFQTKGIALGDLSASQYETMVRSGTSERITVGTTADQDVIGLLQNVDADTAADQLQLSMMGFSKAIAFETLQPFDELAGATTGRLKRADSGDMIIGRYCPELRSGGTDLPAAAAGDNIRVLLYGARQTKSNIVWGKATYDFDVDGGTEGVIVMSNQSAIPSGATVMHSFVRNQTTCTSSGDAATLALATSAGGVTFLAATAISAAAAQVITLTPNAVNSKIFTCNISGDFNATGIIETVSFQFTSDGSATATEIVTGLKGQINAIMDQVASAGNAIIASGTATLVLTAEGTALGVTPFSATGGSNDDTGTWTIAQTTAFTHENRWDATSGPGGIGVVPAAHDMSRPSTYEEMSAAGIVTLTTAGGQDLTAGKFDLIYAYIPA